MKGKSDTVPSQENRQGIDDRHQKIVSVLAAHKVALWEYDIRTGVCSFDEDYFRILGLTEAGVEFSDIDDFYRFAHPDDVSNYREAFGRMLASDTKNACIRVRCVGNKGQVIWLEDNFFSYQSDEEGRPQKLVAYTGNITARCEGEARIRALEERNRKVIEALPEFIFIMDDRFFITDVLMASGTVLLHPVEELIGADGRTIYSAEVSDLFVRNIRECLADGKIREIEYPLDVESGRHYFQARIAPYEKNKVLALIHDIGDRVRWSKELIEAKARAEESDRMKSVFLATMSHEIRTPLNAIVGFSKLISSAENAEEVQQYTDIIDSNSDLLLQLINDILDLSKIEAGTLEFHFADMSLNSLCREEYEIHKGRVHDGVELVFDGRDEDVEIKCDHNRLAQVVTNLLSNAIKFTHNGEIRFGYDMMGDTIEFYVADTGIGMSAQAKERIFDRFIKLNSFASGTGLGLAISKMIVEKIGGRIWVESEEGEGTTFRFTIPYRSEKKAAADALDEPSAAQETGSLMSEPDAGASAQGGALAELASEGVGGRTGKRILIAEDIESNYMLMKAFIGKRYEVIRAHDGQEAIDLFPKVRPDLVFMDIKMPVVDGYEATRAIRKISKEVPILAITAFAFESDREKALEAGCTDYLTKPISRDLLNQKLILYLGE